MVFRLLTDRIARTMLVAASAGALLSIFPVDAVEPQPSVASAKLETFTDEQGAGYFALSVRDVIAPSPAKAVDLALLVDLSASQSGPLFQQTVELTRRTIDRLPGGSRVQIWRTNSPGSPLLARPSAVGSNELVAAVAQLASEAPLGTSDLEQSFRQVESWLNDKAGDLPKVALYLGDGRSSAGAISPEQGEAIAVRMTAAAAPLLWIPVGSSAEPRTLSLLVTKTGGRILAPKGISAEQINAFVDEVSAALAVPVFYPNGHTLSRPVESAMPTGLPPLRSDVETLMVAKGKPASSLTVSIQGVRQGRPAKIALEGRTDPESVDTAYVKPLFERWSAQAEKPALGQAATNLAVARQSTEARSQQLLAQAKAALAARKLPFARDLYRLVIAFEPDNPEALAGLRAVEQLSAGGDRSTPTQQPAKARAEPIADAAERQRAESQRIVRLVSQAIAQSNKLKRSDPEQAMVVLKGTLATLEASSALSPESIASLRRKLESELRSAFVNSRRIEQERLERDRVTAQIESRRRQEREEVVRQWTTKELMERYRTLYAAGNFGAAEMVAQEIQRSDPDSVAGAAARLQSATAGRYVAIEQVERLKQEEWWGALASVEAAAIPFPASAPIAYPSAQVWEELTVRRQKYNAMDLAPVSPGEQTIRRALIRPVTIDFDQTPLTDVVEFLKEYTGTNIVLDPPGLQEAGVRADTPVTLRLEDVSLKSALKLILDQLGMSYIVRDEVLLITSERSASAEMVTKVYDVADLTTPISDFNLSGVGLLGAMGGGNAGQGGLGAGMDDGGLGAAITPQLVGLIQRSVAPDTWDINGGQGSIRSFGKNLVIRASPAVHERIGGALTGVRQSQPPQVTIGAGGAAADWEGHFRDHVESGPALQAAVGELAERGRHEQIVPLIRAALRHQPAEPWMYEALALSLRLQEAPAEQIRDALLSQVDQSPGRLDVRLSVSLALAGVGQDAQALTLLRQTAGLFPESINTYSLALHLAEQRGDVDDVAWAADQILRRDWAVRGDEIHRDTRRQLARFEEHLRREGRRGEADRLGAVAAHRLPRDLEVTVQWTGEADIDLCVVEPGNYLCSPMARRTVNGGVLISDGVSTTEQYIAAQAMSGDYELILQPVWGSPTAGMVTVDIVKHKGTPQESRERKLVEIGGSVAPVKIRLDDGRRLARTAVQADEVLIVDKLMAAAGLTDSANDVAIAPEQAGRRGPKGAAAHPADDVAVGARGAIHAGRPPEQAGAPLAGADRDADVALAAQRLRGGANVANNAARQRLARPNDAAGLRGFVPGGGVAINNAFDNRRFGADVPGMRGGFFRGGPNGGVGVNFDGGQGFVGGLNSQAFSLTLPGNGATGAMFVGRQVPFVTDVIPIVSGGAVAFDPVITVLNDGFSLQAQAVVSPDRRYVRLQMAPVFQTIDSIDNPRTINIGGAVGGGAAIVPP